ncbi:His Kinase A (phospho-acceptor) domain-containing protein [Mucilaginibacter gossypiicola]|uniref:histidine kinase n=1 Tax=Mucilaginibacter gossypiicola TaxID=551995 RepID=A0A1H8A9E3_9SPHI|nr:HAMP domain-containing sensor histidine kinase [Mucilaginibacter gossypiicola]SEM67183.1 His Kinase A (phospho-acceptor) domain-containing protein [Mucilaginibacter gossypiicola]
MNTHFFFNSLPIKYRSQYRDHYTYQNLVAIRGASMIFLLLNVIIRILYLVFPVSLTKAQNFPEFNFSNWVFIIVTPVFLIASNLFIVGFKGRKKATTGMSLLVFLFALYIIVCGMYSSFIATSDPSNALTLYLVALSLISVIFVFEYYETVLLLVAVEVFFTSLLFYSQTPATDMLYNQLISAILISGFYFTSRYFFTYKANYYLQVIETREKNSEIEKASEFKNQVLGMVAHDLRNPIAAVESIAMMMELDEVDEDMQDNINMMKASCVKARSIIDDLLEAAQNENIAVFETRNTDLNQWLNGIVNEWKLQQGNKVDVLFINTAGAVNALINHEKFHRVIDNLISNAVKFSKDRDRVDIRLSQQNNVVTIEVQDYGVGIPAAMLPEIFNQFSKAGRTGLRGEKSTGLGLSIVRQIVEKHKGSITVTSTEGQGSTFRIMLPAVSPF